MSEKLIFIKELETLINRYSKENESDTPDFILAMYLNDCLNAYRSAVKARDKWFGSISGININKEQSEFSKAVDEEMQKLNTKT